VIYESGVQTSCLILSFEESVRDKCPFSGGEGLQATSDRGEMSAKTW
jgi:hypothetical protein